MEEDFHEWVLIGNDPDLNIFVLDRRPNGLINKGIRFDVLIQYYNCKATNRTNRSLTIRPIWIRKSS